MALVVTLLVVGVILILLETVLPGLIAGIVGFCCLVAGVIAGYVEFGSQTGNYLLLATLAGLVIGVLAWVKYFPGSPMARPLISKGVVGSMGTERLELLQQTGKALTPLRPSGMALINGERVDVVSEGALISDGTPIKVVAVEGMRVVVRALTEELSTEKQNRK